MEVTSEVTKVTKRINQSYRIENSIALDTFFYVFIKKLLYKFVTNNVNVKDYFCLISLILYTCRFNFFLFAYSISQRLYETISKEDTLDNA